MKQIRNAIIGSAMLLTGALLSTADVMSNSYWGVIWRLFPGDDFAISVVMSIPTIFLMLVGLIIAFWKGRDD